MEQEKSETIWRPMIDGVELLLARGYDLDDSREIILQLLASGSLLSKLSGESFWFRLQTFQGTENFPLTSNKIIPLEFWMECAHAAAFKDFDWKNGAFSFDGRRNGAKESYYGSAYGVLIDLTPITHGTVSLPTQSIQRVRSPDWNVKDQPKTRGRPTANWWPDFSAELALYFLNNGVPEGEGADGQSQILDAVCESLAAQGKTEPSRTQVQPVINRVLASWRSAGK